MLASTIYDVAEHAGVSITTVSRVLNNNPNVKDSTRQKVLTAIEELNFKKNFLAAALMTKQTSTFGLIIPDIKNLFYADLTRAIEDAANQHGLNVILCNTDNDLSKEAMYIDFLIQKGIDGIIFSTPEVKDSNIKEVVENYPDLPVIVIGSRVHNVSVNEVLADNVLGAYLATQHLLEAGHRKIAYLSGGKNSFSGNERRKGYEKALSEYGVEVNPEWISIGEFKSHSGYERAKWILSQENPPTAIFAGNDLIAVGVYQVARELSLRIPEDLSVIGFDDTEYAEILYPTLTTVHIPTEEIGSRAMQIAILELESKKMSKETVVFRPTLIQRNSVFKFPHI